MATKASLGIYRQDVRTVDNNVVTDAALLNTTSTEVHLGGYGATPQMQNNKLGLLLEVARLAYNIANPD